MLARLRDPPRPGAMWCVPRALGCGSRCCTDWEQLPRQGAGDAASARGQSGCPEASDRDRACASYKSRRGLWMVDFRPIHGYGGILESGVRPYLLVFGVGGVGGWEWRRWKQLVARG